MLIFVFAKKSTTEKDKSIFLIVFGLVMLFSASSIVSYSRYANTYHYFLRQFIWVIISMGAFYFVSKIDYRILKKFAVFFLF